MQRAWKRVRNIHSNEMKDHSGLYAMTYPAIIIFVEQSDELASLEIKFVLQSRLEVELNAVNSRTSRTAGGSNSRGASGSRNLLTRSD